MDYNDILKTVMKAGNQASELRIKYLQHISLLTATLFGVLVSLAGIPDKEITCLYKVSALLFALCTLSFLIALYVYIYAAQRLYQEARRKALESIIDHETYRGAVYNIPKLAGYCEVFGAIAFVSACGCMIAYLFKF